MLHPEGTIYDTDDEEDNGAVEQLNGDLSDLGEGWYTAESTGPIELSEEGQVILSRRSQ